jgi:hypothetical protein
MSRIFTEGTCLADIFSVHRQISLNCGILRHGLGGRPDTYSPLDYFNEFGGMMNAINNNPNMPVKNNIVGPSVAVAEWTPEVVFDTGYLTTYGSLLTAIAVEQ